VSALQDLGMIVVACGTKKSTEEDKARIRDLMGDDAVLLDGGNARRLLDTAYQYHADLMIAGGRNMYTAYKARLPFLDINQEREHAYAGYGGMVTLARQLCLTLEAPIWDQVHAVAPWQ
jgi:nitrogenase molybdenum-cofactor synthesis protein NifE